MPRSLRETTYCVGSGSSGFEEGPKGETILSSEERSVVQHFKENHRRTKTRRFIVPLPKRPNAKTLGESRSQAVRRFITLERSQRSKDQFGSFNDVMEEYFQMGPLKSHNRKYLPPNACSQKGDQFYNKNPSCFRCVCQIFVGPTVHSSLIDVLLRFRFHHVALTTDVSRMYRAVELTLPDRDLHRFVWRSDPNEPLRDYSMTRITFGVSASSFAANMAVKQNALDLTLEYPKASVAIEKSFYVDDGLTEEAIDLQKQLQDLFSSGGFLLRKWNSSDPSVLQHVPSELKETHSAQSLPSPDDYTKTLGIEWNAHLDLFRLTVADLPPLESITKRVLVSDIAKTFDVLGWFSPTIIKVKILLQLLWELKVDWDDPLPPEIRESLVAVEIRAQVPL